MKKEILLFFLLIIFSCSERTKNNPFDPTGEITINLSAVSFDNRVELTWEKPSVEGFSGFNIYRKTEGLDNNFKRIQGGLPASQRFYQDRDLSFGYNYIYYLTITGVDIESKPSPSVSIFPGPGLNWIVDKWGYQIVKATYDLMHPILVYETNWPPTNFGIAPDRGHGLILFSDVGKIEKISLSGKNIKIYEEIRYPYDIIYEPVDSLFWIIDSSGSLYTIDSKTDQIRTISTSFSKPISISIAPVNDLISVVDRKQRKIYQFSHNGSLRSTITRTNGKLLNGPIRYELDEVNDREWLVDRNGEFDYIYTKTRLTEIFMLVDSVFYSGDISASPFDETCWYLSYNAQNSGVLQLSPDGTRQSEIYGYYNPFDILINPYDGTLIVVDSGRSRVIHYDQSSVILGLSDIFNFPVRIRIE